MIKPSNTTLVISSIVVLLLIYMTYVAITTDDVKLRITFLIFVIIMVAVPIFMTPVKVESDANKIRVKYILSNTTYQKKDFDIVEIKKSDLGPTIRLFASGGFLGNIGWFKSSKIGTFYGSFLNEKNILLLKNKKTGKKYIIDRPN